MARVRSIGPDFFGDERLADVPALGRLLFAGLWCWADREGRLEDRPRRIKAQVLPYDEVDVEVLLTCLNNGGFIRRYISDGQRYIEIVNWTQWQKPEPIPRPQFDVEARAYAKVLRRDPCSYCGAVGVAIHIDHIEPYVNGGAHAVENLTAACKRCNSRKHDRSLLSFMATKPWEGRG